MLDNTSFAKFKTDACRAFNHIGTAIKIAQSETEVERIVAYVSKDYETSFPELTPAQSRDYLESSFNFYCEDENGDINGTISLVVDSEHGFPEEGLLKADIQHYRDAGQLVFQLGRFVVSSQNNKVNVAMSLLQVLYLLPKLVGSNVVLGMVRPKDITLHEKRFGAKVLNRHTGETYGSKYEFATVAWVLDELNPAFFKRTGCVKMEKIIKPIYLQQQWNRYADVFGSVQTIFQRELQLITTAYLQGNVADFGCGTAKLAPLLSDDNKISSYTGIDYSSRMVSCANHLISTLNRPSFTVWEGKIEDYQGGLFDSAVSINSYYSWPKPEAIMAHIASLLKPEGTFVLATPNSIIKAQMPKMLKEAEKELLLHPSWSAFKQQNLAFVNNPDAHFIDMDDLVEQAQEAGFAIQSCHQSFYLGALNFLVLQKKRLAA